MTISPASPVPASPLPEHLAITPLSLAHSAGLFALTVANRDHLRPWLEWVDRIRLPTDTLAFVADAIKQSAAGRAQHFIIDAGGSMAGTIGLIDIQDGQAVVGYWIAQAHCNRGIASQALADVKTFARDRLGLRRLRLEVLEGNEISARVARHCDFVLAEKIDDGTLLHGRPVARLVYTCALTPDQADQAAA